MMTEPKKKRAYRTGKVMLVSPFYTAWTAYSNSAQYKRAIDALTVGINRSQEIYLANRISNAYHQGWKDALKSVKDGK